MPGKVNPVIPEAVNQTCFQVIGNDLAITLAAEAGQLQLNAMEPLIVYNILSNLRNIRSSAPLVARRAFACCLARLVDERALVFQEAREVHSVTVGNGAAAVI